MKYAILGSGGIGGSLGGFLALAGADVTFLARGKHLAAMETKGLVLHSGLKGDVVLPKVKASTVEAYDDVPDVIFVTVKGYSLQELIPFLAKYKNKPTLVIPLLNIYGTGDYLHKTIPGLQVVNGCIYIVAYVNAPGEITQENKIFRVVMGTNGDSPLYERLLPVAEELRSAGIKVDVTKEIGALAFKKFAFISPYAATGAYFDYTAGEIRQDPEAMALFKNLIGECAALAKAMGLKLQDDLVEAGLKTLNAMGDSATASMQKDLAQGKNSEIQGLVLQLVAWGKEYNLAMPNYALVSKGLTELQGK